LLRSARNHKPKGTAYDADYCSQLLGGANIAPPATVEDAAFGARSMASPSFLMGAPPDVLY